ncbi:HEAT repeat domain-containing protein [Virgisporangium aurantiacum]|uniref:HEAT repeat-containing protein n=1 Tax=Virgisporangium aurantiacum TaxID=175570 RepID=A0A8J3ZGP6_9ACTN|nr:hypothetical protein [Virgisporangium aurantiacum]GIJ62587.1 hypothetical protein Vau01_101030 [Virgisporangium aurantiacum]
MTGWAERWNADRLVAGVEDALLRWTEEPRRTPERLHALLDNADPRAIVWLETVYRRRHRTLVGLLGTDGSRDAAVAAVLTLDRNGHLREAGVRHLAGCTERYALTFLLLRLNDPVAAVRDLAIGAVGDRIAAGTGDPAVLVRLVPVLLGLGTRVRAGPVVRSVHGSLLQGDAGRAALWAGARGDDPAVRAGCLRLLATVEPVPALREALRESRRGRDPALRHWATGVVTAAGTDPAHQRELLPLLEADTNPRVRWQALRARARLPDSGPYLRRARLDPDARVRYLARVSLRALGETGSADVYRATLADPAASRNDVTGALAGLADMGGAGDAARVVPFLDHPAARVRGEAWRALAVLDPSEFGARTHRPTPERDTPGGGRSGCRTRDG